MPATHLPFVVLHMADPAAHACCSPHSPGDLTEHLWQICLQPTCPLWCGTWLTLLPAPAAAFTALGNMASALADVGAEVVVGPALPRIADQIKEAISNKGRQRHSCPEALQVGQLKQQMQAVP